MEVERVIDLSANEDNRTLYYVLLPILGGFFYHITFKIINQLSKIITELKAIKKKLGCDNDD